jgi:hypothetical protein
MAPAGMARPHLAQWMAALGGAAPTGVRQFGQKRPSAGTAWPQLAQWMASVCKNIAISYRLSPSLSLVANA